MFIWPGLKGRERTCARFALVAVPALFAAGSAVAYRFFAPAVLNFFLSFGSGDGVEALWSFKEYLSLLAGLMLAVGIALQMPLVMLALFALGIASPRKVASARPYIVLLIFLLAAILTPPDVTSQVMLGAPLYLLFEATLFAGKIIRRAKK
jgi:sec-independent protein translocase protein TatC